MEENEYPSGLLTCGMRRISIILLCSTYVEQEVNFVITWTGGHTIICKTKVDEFYCSEKQAAILSIVSD